MVRIKALSTVLATSGTNFEPTGPALAKNSDRPVFIRVGPWAYAGISKYYRFYYSYCVPDPRHVGLEFYRQYAVLICRVRQSTYFSKMVAMMNYPGLWFSEMVTPILEAFSFQRAAAPGRKSYHMDSALDLLVHIFRRDVRDPNFWSTKSVFEFLVMNQNG